MSNAANNSPETVYIGETQAEREAYDALENLGAIWRARAAAHEPFELARRTVKPKVSPMCRRRATPVKLAAPGLFATMIARVSSLFTSNQLEYV